MWILKVGTKIPKVSIFLPKVVEKFTSVKYPATELQNKSSYNPNGYENLIFSLKSGTEIAYLINYCY